MIVAQNDDVALGILGLVKDSKGFAERGGDVARAASGTLDKLVECLGDLRAVEAWLDQDANAVSGDDDRQGIS